MPDLLVDLETPKTDAPLYQRIADSIRTDVLAGRLRRGERVPSTRALAKELKVNRNTVAQAYEQLIAEGFLEGKHGSGTYVARELPQANFNAGSARRGQRTLRRVAFANSPCRRSCTRTCCSRRTRFRRRAWTSTCVSAPRISARSHCGNGGASSATSFWYRAATA